MISDYQDANNLNKLRVKVMKNFEFYKVIYNSSVNMEALQSEERHIAE